MKRSELLARSLIIIAVLGAVAIPLILRARTPLIHARMAEAGGWTPDVLQAKVGEPLHLRLTSDDVRHGFAVGQLDMQSVDVEPGKVAEATLLFDKPGTYTYYCTLWCGVNHWRMRGAIEVSGDPAATLEPVPAPLYARLGLDIDAPHDSPSVPADRPSASRGGSLAGPALAGFIDPQWYREHSPYQTWQALRADPSMAGATDQGLWDAVALIWRSNTAPEALAAGQGIYAQNCAACHGETGAGDGVFAAEIASAGAAGSMTGMAGMGGQGPADFSDPRRMLGASPALLQGKILRGGMGSGMPMWGSIFTEDQMWDLVAYLYSFQFEYR